VGDGEPVWAVSATDWGRTEAPHGGVRHGTWRRGERAYAEGEGKGKGARQEPYHAWKLRRRPAGRDWRRRGGIAAARGSADGGTVLGPSCGTVALEHRGEVGEVDAAEEEREREAAAKKGEGTVLGVRITATDPVPSAVRCGSALPRCCGASRRERRLGR
jgi:hypothetical protein